MFNSKFQIKLLFKNMVFRLLLIVWLADWATKAYFAFTRFPQPFWGDYDSLLSFDAISDIPKLLFASIDLRYWFGGLYFSLAQSCHYFPAIDRIVQVVIVLVIFYCCYLIASERFVFKKKVDMILFGLLAGAIMGNCLEVAITGKAINWFGIMPVTTIKLMTVQIALNLADIIICLLLPVAIVVLIVRLGIYLFKPRAGQEMEVGKINRIRYAALCVVGISLILIASPFKSGVEQRAWFQYAIKFDSAGSKMNANAENELGLKYFAERRKMQLRFLLAKQPTEDEILSVLTSPDRKLQKVGLIAMSIKPIETDQVIAVLFQFLQDQDRDIRAIAAGSLGGFTQFPESKKAVLGKQLLETITKEENTGVLFVEIPLLGKFPSQEAAAYLTEQLMKEGDDNRIRRYSAGDALKAMGDSFYDKAAEYVKKHGSAEIKKELLNREEYWKTGKNKTHGDYFPCIL
jgi:hypothetical protein